MRKKFLCVLLSSLCFCGSAFAEKDYSSPNTPWLKDVKISPYLTEPSPTIPMNIYGENGTAIMATLTEDVPFLVMAETAIFEPYPPDTYKGIYLPNARWEEKPVIHWHFNDWETRKNSPASVVEELAVNQMIIKPTRPTGNASILCFSSRKMSYDLENGRRKTTYVNSSCAANVRVQDITPPLCGFEITTKDGKNGICWPVESPSDKYPLPKFADVYFSGSLFTPDSDEVVVRGIELGDNMVINVKEAALSVTRRDVITIKIIGDDNFKLDAEKIRFGICGGPGGIVVGAINEEVIHLAKRKLPDSPHLFLEAYDVAGNKQVMYIPMKVRRR